MRLFIAIRLAWHIKYSIVTLSCSLASAAKPYFNYWLLIFQRTTERQLSVHIIAHARWNVYTRLSFIGWGVTWLGVGQLPSLTYQYMCFCLYTCQHIDQPNKMNEHPPRISIMNVIYLLFLNNTCISVLNTMCQILLLQVCFQISSTLNELKEHVYVDFIYFVYICDCFNQ